MRTTYISFLFLAFIQISYGQSDNLKQARRAFASQDYTQAIISYELEEEKSLVSLKNLADSYYYLGESDKAVAAYKQVFDQYQSIADEYLIRYIDAAKQSKDYVLANDLATSYLGYATNIPHDLVDGRKLENFELTMVKGAPGKSAFGPILYQNKLIFASDNNAARPIYDRTKEPYLDLYIADISNNKLSNAELFAEDIDTDLHESNMSFTPDGKHVYFTRNNSKYRRIGNKRIGVLQIFKADLVGDKWTNITPVPFNTNRYSVTHPSVSKDGLRLYFSSDKPGGFGSYDIYVTNILADGTYSKPVNLGPAINTEAGEYFPYVADNNDLYFTSKRITGLGGLDLYKSVNNSGSFSQAENLVSLNSNKDDFSMIIDTEGESGYISSNRDGNDRIYHFIEIED